MAAKDYIHGHRAKGRTPTYNSWRAMKDRCNNPKHPWYSNYGGRGISYDPRWERFKAFFEEMLERPEGYDLDRIDPDKNYTMDNCRWLPQSKNRGRMRR